MQIDINCDMGESFGNYQMGNDAELMNYISSTNIACGFHAGDPLIMSQTVRLAADKGVAIGAHPSYPDLQGFGRRQLDMTPTEIETTIIYQIGALHGFAKAAGVPLRHVKAHGALYNVAAAEKAVAKAYVQAVACYDPTLSIVCLATSDMLIEQAHRAGLKVIKEAFADRRYNADGTLVNRKIEGGLIRELEVAVKQVMGLIKYGEIIAMDGTKLKLAADTVCIHGDNPSAIGLAQALYNRLKQEGINIVAPA